MRTPRRSAPGARRRVVGVFSALLVPAVMGWASAAAAPAVGTAAPSTTVTAPPTGLGVTLQTDLDLAAGGATTGTATFTFVDANLPEVTLYRAPGGSALLQPIGETAPLAGTAQIGVRMFSASPYGPGTCPVAQPVAGPGFSLVGAAFTCRWPTTGPWPVMLVDSVVPTPADDTARLTEALGLLLAGPEAGARAAGLSSPFSAATAGALASVVIGGDGVATVDLAASITTSLPSPSGDEVVRGLDGTLGQVTALTGARYTIGGSCDAFGTWTGLGSCTRTRLQMEQAPYAASYTGPERVAGPAGGPIAEALLTEAFEGVLTWALGVEVPAGQDVVASVATRPEARQVVVTVSIVPLPPAAPPITPGFTG